MRVNQSLTPLFEVFTKADLESLRGAFSGSRPHPLVSLLGDPQRPSQVAYNTVRAIRHILRCNKTWLKRIRERLLDKSDPTNPAGALAEIRAFGALLEAGFNVAPLSTEKGRPTADFGISPIDVEVIIEVHCRQLSHEVQKSIDEHAIQQECEFQKWREENPKGGVYMSQPHIIRPFGDPKQGRTVTARAISALCQMKSDEKQFSDRSANILWIDLQDDYTLRGMFDENTTSPIRSWNGKFTSGELWYALYGWKGAPVFELFPDVPLIEPSCMEHNGRYKQPTLLSAVIAMFPRATVLLEHPFPTTMLPNVFRERAMLLPQANVGRSLCNFAPTLVKKTVKQQKRLIMAIRKAFFKAEYV